MCYPACAEGWFGRNCSLSCTCKNGGVCDPVTGSCRCPPGVSGELCQDGQYKSCVTHSVLCACHVYLMHSIQVVLRVSMGSSVIRSVTVLIMDGVIARMERVCVTRDCTEGSAIFVSQNLLFAFKTTPFMLFCAFNVHCVTFFKKKRVLFRVHAACPKWMFGPGCSEECVCVQKNTVECNRRHGACVCKPGYRGERCGDGASDEWLECIDTRLHCIVLFYIFYLH